MGGDTPLAAGDSAIGRETMTRRSALAAVGATVAGSVVPTASAAPDADATVENAGSGFLATNGGATVYEGEDLIDAIQAAVDSLSAGRSSKERVLVTASGEVGPHEWDGDLHAVDLPSYTVLDVPGTITVADEGEPLVLPVRAQDVDSVEIPRLTVEGNPRYGTWLRSVTDLTLGTITMSLSAGLGVRIDDSGASGRTTDVTLDSASISGSGTHGVETYGVDGIDIGRVHTADTGGCGLLLNDTTDASVEEVIAVDPDPGGGYAGFRVANDAGPNIEVGHVAVRGGARGVFGVSGSQGVTIGNVHLVDNDVNGILIQDCQETTVHGGLVKDGAGEPVRIDSRSSDDFTPAQNVSINGLRVVDTARGASHDYAIRETGPGTNDNEIRGNNVRGGGPIETDADSTTVENNYRGESEALPAGTYRIEAVHSGKVLDVSGGSQERGTNVLQWGYHGGDNQHWTVDPVGGRRYTLTNVATGQALTVADWSLDDGASLVQMPDEGQANQRFHVVERADGQYSIDAVHTGKSLDVEAKRTDNGADVVQWPWNSGYNQRWRFEAV